MSVVLSNEQAISAYLDLKLKIQEHPDRLIEVSLVDGDVVFELGGEDPEFGNWEDDSDE